MRRCRRRETRHVRIRAASSPEDERLREQVTRPNVFIYGLIGDETVRSFLQQVSNLPPADPVILELSTEGGDAEGARRIALEVRMLRKWHDRTTLFLGKTMIMSAGITIMAAFPRDCRFLTEDAVLLIHERRLLKTLNLDGPIRAEIQIVREMLHQLEVAQKLECDGFEELVAGSRIGVDEMYERATSNCYLNAEEALDLGLIAGVV